ncbi:MAG: hypothetical protein RL518_70 [Pseudomonadota bacterium]
MALTRLDCHLYRGEKAAHDVSSFVAFNPEMTPSRMIFAGSSAARESLGSQVAYRLAIDYFLKGVEESYATQATKAPLAKGEESVVKVLEDAFRSANSSVYSFGHKLSAGGRMAATLLGVAIQDGRIATGRVGFGSVYLFRKNQLYPFFDPPEGEIDKVGDAQEFPDHFATRKYSFVGTNSLVDVEMASVDLQGEDIICAFSRPLTSLNETLLFESLEALVADGFPLVAQEDPAARLCHDVFTEPETLSYALVASVGPDAIYCSRPVASGF